jgi:hypothetical protein
MPDVERYIHASTFIHILTPVEKKLHTHNANFTLFAVVLFHRAVSLRRIPAMSWAEESAWTNSPLWFLVRWTRTIAGKGQTPARMLRVLAILWEGLWINLLSIGSFWRTAWARDANLYSIEIRTVVWSYRAQEGPQYRRITEIRRKGSALYLIHRHSRCGAVRVVGSNIFARLDFMLLQWVGGRLP